MAASRRSQLELGQIVRPHGLHGAVVIRLDSTQSERLAVGSTLDSDAGVLTVRAARALKDRYVVSFLGVDTIEGAEALRGVTLRGEPLDLDGVLWVDEVLGARVVTVEGTDLGVVQSIEANPASDLFVLDTGVLIPARFVLGEMVDHTLTVELPEGLV